MNLEEFVKQERKALAEERLRLSARSSKSNTSSINSEAKDISKCPARILLEQRNNKNIKCNLQKNGFNNLKKSQKPLNTVKENEPRKVNDPKAAKKKVSSQKIKPIATSQTAAPLSTPRTPPSLKTLPQTYTHGQDLSSLDLDLQDVEQESNISNSTYSLLSNECPDNDFKNATALGTDDDDDKISLGNFSTKTFSVEGSVSSLSKATKELANQKQQNANVQSEQNEAAVTPPVSSNLKKQTRQDDMEQWVTDTFYSYFPGYNNELQNRQHYIRARQAEYQQNLLKHQMLEQNAKQNAAAQKKSVQNDSINTNTKESESNLNISYSKNSINKNVSHITDKTDLEIINVNNPNYEPPKTIPRPGSARHKLLQDLRHTDLTNIITGDAIIERNRTNEELALARKRDYQRELMAQIEEKRRTVELLREKERLQEEALTRRIQEQLKTIHLEEQLEKEKMLADKIRLEAEQNRKLRANMLAKLENDAKNLYKESRHKSSKSIIEANKENSNMKRIPSSTSSGDQTNNKVYQYFSNSARHEYRRGQPLPAAINVDLEIPEMSRTERECFHLCEKICPLCDEPLKNYESCCLRCQRQLSLKMSMKNDKTKSNDEKKSEKETETKASPSQNQKENETKMEVKPETDVAELADEDSSEVDRDVKATEGCVSSFSLLPSKHDTSSERSFEILEVKYTNDKGSDDIAESPPMPTNSKAQLNKVYKNNLTTDNPQPPYSTSISPNSVFHPDYKLPSLKSKEITFDPLLKFNNVETPLKVSPLIVEPDIDKVRKETDRRLSRYMKNYADLARNSSQNSAQTSTRSKSESYNRSTQTTPETSGRRDVVLQDANNLSMPLLREMPKMTRKESNKLVEQATMNNSQRKMENLKRRWEIPAVQKFSISPNSPRVLTQVGAIRKQLQAEYLFDDDYA